MIKSILKLNEITIKVFSCIDRDLPLRINVTPHFLSPRADRNASNNLESHLLDYYRTNFAETHFNHEGGIRRLSLLDFISCMLNHTT